MAIVYRYLRENKRSSVSRYNNALFIFTLSLFLSIFFFRSEIITRYCPGRAVRMLIRGALIEPFAFEVHKRVTRDLEKPLNRTCDTNTSLFCFFISFSLIFSSLSCFNLSISFSNLNRHWHDHVYSLIGLTIVSPIAHDSDEVHLYRQVNTVLCNSQPYLVKRFRQSFSSMFPHFGNSWTVIVLF